MFTRTECAIVIAVALLCPTAASAAMLSYIRDTISDSAPSAAASHVIEFTTAHAVPPSGSITITPEPGAFDVEAGLAYGDMDLAVWDGSSFVDRTLADTPSATEDGVSVVPGSDGSVSFSLSSALGIAADTPVRVVIGKKAAFQSVGSSTIALPSAQRSYRIRIATFDASAAPLDTGTTMIAVVLPVSVSGLPTALAPTRTNGLPSGTIAAGSATVELSLETDVRAHCRYALEPGIPYAAMTNDFAPTIGTTFWHDVSGLADNTNYTYYVRCNAEQNVANDDDYVISFGLAPTPYSSTSVEGSGIIGRGGAGDYPNGSAVLFSSSVTLSGWTAPQSTVRIMRDGVLEKSVQARPDGSFRADITGLERGLYTFTASALDPGGARSASVATTLTLQQGTSNAVSDIMIPPTLVLERETVAKGEGAVASGRSVPGARIDLALTAAGAAASTLVATSSATGAWRIEVPASKLAGGTYALKARAVAGDSRQSGFSSIVYLGVGGPPLKPVSGATDLNGDGRVNLIDFSIMLTGWQKDGPGDINGDGTVNLADFSILLFAWTG